MELNQKEFLYNVFQDSGKESIHMDFKRLCSNDSFPLEQYPIIGNHLDFKDINSIKRMFVYKKFFHFGQCFDKSAITGIYMQMLKKVQTYISTGSLILSHKENNGDITQYGFKFNPPYEMHNWVTLEDNSEIIDVCIPSVIEAANISNHLVGMTKFYIAGKVESANVIYTEHYREPILRREK